MRGTERELLVIMRVVEEEESQPEGVQVKSVEGGGGGQGEMA